MTTHKEQEPVAWMRKDETCTDCFVWERTDEHTIPLYTTPPPVTESHKRKRLTDEQIDEGRRQPWGTSLLDAFKAGVRFAEAAHGIKGDA